MNNSCDFSTTPHPSDSRGLLKIWNAMNMGYGDENMTIEISTLKPATCNQADPVKFQLIASEK
jgi:hypothetical protein